MEREKILEVKNLSVSFNTHGGVVKAVRNISFDLYKGETFAIVGESGSGKSVTVKAILGILSGNAMIESGQIIYRGQDLASLDEDGFHKIRGKRISMVFQDPLSSLNPIMKIGKQITEALKLSLNMKQEEANKKALEIMKAVAIPEPEKRMNQYPFQFSGGMRQRIVIAIALASEPEILICDEPTTALDVTVQSQILELLASIKKDRNISVIFITHDLGVVANIADRVGVIYAGKIVEKGTVNDIFYNSQHPYTWALLSSMPDLETKQELFSIPGTPPNMLYPPEGDAFAVRNRYALEIDYKYHPPFFKVSETHYVASWLLHPKAPEVSRPAILQERINRMEQRRAVNEG